MDSLMKTALAAQDMFPVIRLIEELETDLSRVTAELQTVRSEFADEVIALITTEQAAMSRLYGKHAYGINKVCNRLKLFVGDLLKKQKEPV